MTYKPQSKADQLRAMREQRSAKGLRVTSRASPSSAPVGDGVSLTSIAHPPGLIDKIADAIRDGKLGSLKRGRPKITGPHPWEEAGMSKRSWYRRQAEKRDK